MTGTIWVSGLLFLLHFVAGRNLITSPCYTNIIRVSQQEAGAQIIDRRNYKGNIDTTPCNYGNDDFPPVSLAAEIRRLGGTTIATVELGRMIFNARTEKSPAYYDLTDPAVTSPNSFVRELDLGVVGHLHIENVHLVKISNDLNYITSGYNYKTIVIRNVTFERPAIDNPGKIIGTHANRYPERRAAPEMVLLENLKEHEDYNSFISSFRNIPKNFTIQHTKMNTIATGSFRWENAPQTEHIDLRFNELYEIDFVTSIFERLREQKSFKTLRLSGNKVETIKPGVLRSYPVYLDVLDLSNNNLKLIDACALDWTYQITQLDGTQNRVVNLDQNYLQCEQGCQGNFWMYRVLYEASGPYYGFLNVSKTLGCRNTDSSIAAFYESLKRCYKRIPCYGNTLVEFGFSLIEKDDRLTFIYVATGVGVVLLLCALGALACIVRIVKSRTRIREAEDAENMLDELGQVVMVQPSEYGQLWNQIGGAQADGAAGGQGGRGVYGDGASQDPYNGSRVAVGM